MAALDTMNHSQRARFGRSIYRRLALPRTIGTKLLMERIAGGAK